MHSEEITVPQQVVSGSVAALMELPLGHPLSMTVMRDGNFGVGYMALPGVLKPMLQTFTYNESYADVASKVASGVVASVGSQVFDTVKTAYQKAEKGMRFFDVAKQPFVTHGVRGYFNGGAWRAGRIVPAVYILSMVTERVNTFFNQENRATANNTSSTKNDRASGFSKQ